MKGWNVKQVLWEGTSGRVNGEGKGRRIKLMYFIFLYKKQNNETH
jgi:hypothetical protein